MRRSTAVRALLAMGLLSALAVPTAGAASAEAPAPVDRLVYHRDPLCDGCLQYTLASSVDDLQSAAVVSSAPGGARTSHDGQSIAWTRPSPSGGSDVTLAGPDGQDPHVISSLPGAATVVDWSRDGSTLLLKTGGGLTLLGTSPASPLIELPLPGPEAGTSAFGGRFVGAANDEVLVVSHVSGDDVKALVVRPRGITQSFPGDYHQVPSAWALSADGSTFASATWLGHNQYSICRGR